MFGLWVFLVMMMMMVMMLLLYCTAYASADIVMFLRDVVVDLQDVRNDEKAGRGAR